MNWRDVQRMNVVNNVDMSSLRAPWQNGPYENQHTKNPHRTPRRNRHLEKNNYFLDKTFTGKLIIILSRVCHL